MKNEENQKGITLIALVVTSIVLLILAGVSIAMLTGENGIMSKAATASWKSKLGDAQDIVALDVSDAMSKYFIHAYVDENDTESEAFTTIDGAIEKGCTTAATELGDGYTVIPNTTGGEGKIGIEYESNGKTYSVTGSLSTTNTKVQWGKMQVGDCEVTPKGS